MEIVKCRKNLQQWAGETKTEDLVADVEEIFKPTTEAEFHAVPDKTEPSTLTPTKDDVGIHLLDKSLRDITGVLHETKHLLTHEADTLKTRKMPCWICTRAATRQQRKYSEKLRANQEHYRHTIVML